MDKFAIYAVSDATGELAVNLATSAIGQFPEIDVEIIRRPGITHVKKLEEVVAEVKKRHAVILFTMVSNELRREMLTIAKRENVIAMDIMGPALDMLANYFHQLPSSEPGLQYGVTRDYFNRTEAVEYATRHDEGLGVDDLESADIILIGISRTSKTPLSIYLAYQGYRTANMPIVVGVPLPQKIFELDYKKLVGLIVSPDRLMVFRSSRLKNLGRPDSEQYAQREHIEKELAYAKEIFSKLPGITIVDVTGKAIEEIASEILHDKAL
jgi:[pyruvate, water dikinase]-phosphate phosphotransferase / [pyruvate, water dikinase] kinase